MKVPLTDSIQDELVDEEHVENVDDPDHFCFTFILPDARIDLNVGTKPITCRKSRESIYLKKGSKR